MGYANSLIDYCTRNLFEFPFFGFRPFAEYHPVKVNVRETDDMVHVEAELPGFEKEEISVLLVDNTLSISAEKKESKENNEGYLYKEYSHSKFQRSVYLPFEVNAAETKAYYNAGILRVDIPKNSNAQPSTEIEIN